MAADSAESGARLRDLAARAATQAPPRGRGSFEYIRTRGLHGGSNAVLQPDGTLRHVDSWVDPTEREFWISPDGAGRIEETRSGRRTDTSGVYPVGDFHYFGPLPTDANELDRHLAPMVKWGTYSWFKAVDQVWSAMVLVPEVQRALLEVLAAKPDIKWEGTVTDPIDRPAVAVSTARRNLGTYRLFFHPAGGALLASETLSRRARRGRPERNFRAWLDAGYVGGTNERP